MTRKRDISILIYDDRHAITLQQGRTTKNEGSGGSVRLTPLDGNGTMKGNIASIRPGAARDSLRSGHRYELINDDHWRSTMKALVKKEAKPGLWLEDVPEPTVGINDLLIRGLRAGICGTDLHIYNWDAWAQRTIPVPLVIGHEFVGQVVEVGSNVNDFHPGDIVSEIGRASCRERV